LKHLCENGFLLRWAKRWVKRPLDKEEIIREELEVEEDSDDDDLWSIKYEEEDKISIVQTYTQKVHKCACLRSDRRCIGITFQKKYIFHRQHREWALSMIQEDENK
jgi:hypothetical protein